MCFGGKKKSSGPSAAEIIAQQQALQQAALIEQQRQILAQQQDELARRSQQFQDAQNAYIARMEELTRQAMEREAAQYEAFAAAQHAARLPALVQTNTGIEDRSASEEERLLDSQRRGRRALRIDLNAPAIGGASGSGLNVPRG